MKQPILSLRVSRRAIGVSVLSEDKCTLMDGRHLRSKRNAVEASALRYVTRLVGEIRPKTIVVDCAFKSGGQTEAVWRSLEGYLTGLHIPIRRVTPGALLEAFAFPGLPSRLALRTVAELLFQPDLERVTGAVRPFVIDAAAAGLFASTEAALGESSA